MDFTVDMLDITIDFDAKHLSKRLRTTIIGGKMSILEKKIDAQVVKSILHSQGLVIEKFSQCKILQISKMYPLQSNYWNY